MNSLKKTIALACAASVLSFGVAVAQTAPAAPDAGRAAAPAAGDPAAPAADATRMKKPMKKTAKKKVAQVHGQEEMKKAM